MGLPWGGWIGHDPKSHPGAGKMDAPDCIWAGGMAMEAHPGPALWEQGMCTAASRSFSFPMPAAPWDNSICQPGWQGMKPGSIPSSGNETLARVRPLSIPLAGLGGRGVGDTGGEWDPAPQGPARLLPGFPWELLALGAGGWGGIFSCYLKPPESLSLYSHLAPREYSCSGKRHSTAAGSWQRRGGSQH